MNNHFQGSVSISPQSSKTAPKRIYLRAKRSSPSNLLICVLDTNVLLNHVSCLKRFIVKTKSFSTVKSFIVPWIVLQELDGLKNDKKIVKLAGNAIKFLNEQFKIKDGLFKGETRTNNKEEKKLLVEDNNDDQVLKCCLNVVSTISPNENVMLLTDDINLQNKALVHNVETMTMQEFMKVHFSKLELPITEVSNKDNDSEIIVTSNPNKYRRSESGKTIPIAKEEQTKRRATLPSNTITLCKPSSTKNTLQANNTDLNLLKSKLETRLIDFMIKKLGEQYGPEDWKDVVPQFNPNNTSLVECLRLIKQLWIAVFSQHFNRNKSVLKQIEELLGLLKLGNQKNIASTVEALLESI